MNGPVLKLTSDPRTITSGKWADQSGRHNHGTIVGARPYQIAPGISGYKFDGVDDCINLGDDASLDIGAGITVEMWIIPPDSPNTHAGYFGRRNSTMGFYALQLATSNNLECRFQNTAGTSYDITPAPVITPAVWNHNVFLKDDTEIRFYLNAKLIGSNTVTGVIDNTRNFYAGQSGKASYYVKGLISNFTIYPYPRTAGQVAEDMYSSPIYKLKRGLWRK